MKVLNANELNELVSSVDNRSTDNESFFATYSNKEVYVFKYKSLYYRIQKALAGYDVKVVFMA